MIKIPSLRWREQTHHLTDDNDDSAQCRRGFWQKLGAKLTLRQVMSDEQLLLLYATSQDADALEQLVERLHDDIFYYVLSQSDQTIAEDVCQNTWLKVINKAWQFSANRENSAKAYLFRIARNNLIDELRRQQRWQYDSLDDGATDVQQTAVQTLQHQSLTIAYEQVLAALPFAQREAFVLQQEGFSLQQISAICQQNPQTIKSRLRYARNAFKQALGGLHE